MRAGDAFHAFLFQHLIQGPTGTAVPEQDKKSVVNRAIFVNLFTNSAGNFLRCMVNFRRDTRHIKMLPVIESLQPDNLMAEGAAGYD